MINLVYVVNYPIYIYELSVYCSAPVIILSCTGSYIELTLYLRIFR